MSEAQPAPGGTGGTDGGVDRARGSATTVGPGSADGPGPGAGAGAGSADAAGSATARAVAGAVGLSPALHTRACELFGVRYPIVQTGMGWVSGARLTAATAQAGGLGILASATMTVSQLRDAVRKVKERTDAPFGVNLRSDQPDVADRIDFLAQAGVAVASFAQAPRKELIDRLRDHGIVSVATVGARRHAEKVAEWGIDAILAQGGEGGGHTGAVPTSLLLPQVVEAVDVPVLGCGGFFSGAGLVAALAYGADGVAMGTRFLLTQESHVPDHVKQRYLAAGVTDTVVSLALDGFPQRVVRTPLVDELEKASIVTRLPRAVRRAAEFRKVTGTPWRALLQEGLAMRRSQDLTWAQLAMAANAPMLIKASLVDGRTDEGVLPTGQVTGVIAEVPTVAQLIDRVMADADDTLRQLCATAGTTGRAP